MGRFLAALFGDVEESVRRDIDEVARQARALAPANRGRLTESIHVMRETRDGVTVDYGAIHGDRYLFRRANGTPALSWQAPDTDKPLVEIPEEIHSEQLKRLKDRWEHTCGDPGGLPIPVPLDLDPDSPFAEVIREHAERAINGGHEWVEVNLSGTDQVVAWYCSRCDEQQYADGW